MPNKKRCKSKDCKNPVRGEGQRTKAQYCEGCFNKLKRLNSLDPWTVEERRSYMRGYMRKYREDHPGLSTKYVRKYRRKQVSATST